MKRRYKVLLVLFAFVILAGIALNPLLPGRPAYTLARSLSQIAKIIEPAAGDAPRTLTTQLKVVKAEGLSTDLAGRTLDLAFQSPDRLRVSADIDKARYTVGRDGQELWVHAPAKKFGVLGKSGLPRFAAAPEKIDSTRLSPFKLPLTRKELWAAVLLLKVEAQAAETVADQRCRVLRVTPKPAAIQKLKLPEGELRVWIRESDQLPVRLGYSNLKGTDLWLSSRI
jgi:hypothetical protein